MMDRREDLNTIVSGCSIINADGMSVVRGARLLGVPVPERVAGIDLFMRLVGSCAERGWKPYFLGARPEVVRSVVARLRALHPDLRVAGHRSGYWDPEQDADVVSAVAASDADMLFMAVPSPRKEYWLARYLDDLGVRSSWASAGPSTSARASPGGRRPGCSAPASSGRTASARSPPDGAPLPRRQPQVRCGSPLLATRAGARQVLR